jgi:transcriptional regulator with XRE-family HTH domain
MARVREIFAENMKKNRRKCGLTQENLAEKAGVSTHYISMIELARNFPKSEVIERLANALNIEVHVLFLAPRTHEDELEQLHQSIISVIKQAVSESVTTSVETAFEKMTNSEKAKKE